jgi:UDP-N-acetylmuramoyl-tripeptide--D-alanyl-D-alanine ligase
MQAFDSLLSLIDQGAGVSTDTRTLKKGDLFFALRGENFDGNQFAARALEAGACKVLVDDPAVVDGKEFVLVEDVLSTLQQLALLHRRRFAIPVIGITGSNGKTTTKELLHQVLMQRFRVLATQGNLNNHIGVPITLLALKPEHEVAIVEMGASEPGEIARLCLLAEPTLGLISNVGKAHIEGFGSEQEVCRTKAGLYDFLSANGGISLVPEAIHSHPYFRSRVYENAELFTPDRMNGRSVGSVTLKQDFPMVSIEVHHPGRPALVMESKLFGRYNFDNLVNVIKMADHLGLQPDEWKKGIEEYIPRNNRSQVMQDENENTIILDAYNANPSSVARALDHFLDQPGSQRKVVVLGDMLELGAIAPEEHRRVIERLSGYPRVDVLLVGRLFMEAFEAMHRDFGHIRSVGTTAEATAWWENQRFTDSLVLVKGSRGIRLETIFEGINPVRS